MCLNTDISCSTFSIAFTTIVFWQRQRLSLTSLLRTRLRRTGRYFSNAVALSLSANHKNITSSHGLSIHVYFEPPELWVSSRCMRLVVLPTYVFSGYERDLMSFEERGQPTCPSEFLTKDEARKSEGNFYIGAMPPTYAKASVRNLRYKSQCLFLVEYISRWPWESSRMLPTS